MQLAFCTSNVLRSYQHTNILWCSFAKIMRKLTSISQRARRNSRRERYNSSRSIQGIGATDGCHNEEQQLTICPATQSPGYECTRRVSYQPMDDSISTARARNVSKRKERSEDSEHNESRQDGTRARKGESANDSLPSKESGSRYNLRRRGETHFSNLNLSTSISNISNSNLPNSNSNIPNSNSNIPNSNFNLSNSNIPISNFNLSNSNIPNSNSNLLNSNISNSNLNLSNSNYSSLNSNISNSCVSTIFDGSSTVISATNCTSLEAISRLSLDEVPNPIHSIIVEHSLGKMESTCVHCGANYFKGEVSKDGTFKKCCNNGRYINIPRHEGVPDILYNLITGNPPKSHNFLQHFRKYNNALSLASTSYNEPKFDCKGEMRHNFSPMQSTEIKYRGYGGFYVMDAGKAMEIIIL